MAGWAYYGYQMLLAKSRQWLAGRTKDVRCWWLRAEHGLLGVLRLSDVAGYELTMAGWA